MIEHVYKTVQNSELMKQWNETKQHSREIYKYVQHIFLPNIYNYLKIKLIYEHEIIYKMKYPYCFTTKDFVKL